MVKALKIILILVVLWVPLSWALSKFLVIEKPLDHPDAIVILGGSAEYVERTAFAASLFKQGGVQYVIITNDGQKGGWNQEEQRNPYFVERARANLLAEGVPPQAIVELPDVIDGTAEEAAVVLKFAAERSLPSFQLVTSAYHSRRALWIFESHRDKLGIVCSIGITTSRGGQFDPSSFMWFTSVEGWRMVGSEYLKMAYFLVAS